MHSAPLITGIAMSMITRPIAGWFAANTRSASAPSQAPSTV
jgi:hypothetical protein